MTTHEFSDSTVSGMGPQVRLRMLIWLVLSVLAALLVYFGFRAYLNPEFLLNFANHMYC